MIDLSVERDRPFPFDRRTEEVYASPEWESRTGVGQLAQVLFLDEKDVLTVLAFYGDGSGEHGRGAMVVAGYLADTRDWFEVERFWSAALQNHPKIDYFKAAQCQHLDGQFNGWTRDAANAKRLRLAEIVRKHSHRLVEISSTIRWNEYHSVIGDGPVRRTYYHPYFFCFHGVASLAVERANDNFRDHTGRIAFVLDTESYKTMDVDVQQQYNYARETLPEHVKRRMGSTTWDTDIAFPMLQVADLIAWSIRAETEGLGSPVLDVLRNGGQIAGRVTKKWNPSGLAQFVVGVEEKLPGSVQ